MITGAMLFSLAIVAAVFLAGFAVGCFCMAAVGDLASTRDLP